MPDLSKFRAHRSESNVLIAALAGASFLALSFLLCFPAWSSPTTRWVSLCCDSEQGIWFLRWIPFALAHGMDPLVTNYLNYPAGVNLMWNTSIPLAGLMMAPVTEILGPIFAYNLMIVLAIALSAWCAFFALRRYTRSAVAAYIGAAVYGFSPYVVLQSEQHPQLVIAFTPPLMLLLFDEAVIRQSRSPTRVGLLAGVVAAAQLLLSEEVLASETIAVIVLAAVLAGMHRAYIRRRLPHLTEVAYTALLTFLVLGTWPLLIQFFGAQRMGGAIWNPGFYSNDLVNLVVPSSLQAFAPARIEDVMAGLGSLLIEPTAYIGLPLLLLLGAFVGRCWDQALVRAAAVVTGILALLSLGPSLKIAGQPSGFPLPWALVDRYPPMYLVLPTRMSVYVFLGIGLLVAIFVDQALQAPRRRDGLLRGAALGLALLPLLPAHPLSQQSVIPPFFTRDIARVVPAGSVALVSPRSWGAFNPTQMLWQAVAGDRFRMPDAYAYVPNGSSPRLPIVPFNPPRSPVLDAMRSVQNDGIVPALTPSLRFRIALDLWDKRVDTVIVGPGPNDNLMAGFFTQLFERTPIIEGGVAYWPQVLRKGVAP